MSVTKQFARYVTQNIFGMLGISCYIIADTFFIAKAAGTDGITVLNLVLPIYNLIFAIGSMIGVGSAIQYVVEEGLASGADEVVIVNSREKKAIEDHFTPNPELVALLRERGKDAYADAVEYVGNLPVSTKRVIGLFAAIAALFVAISVTAILLMAR